MEERAPALNQRTQPSKASLPIGHSHNQGAFHTDTRRKDIIRPLPSDVIAQIRSAATINSLNDVVLGLLQNALDASSTRVEIVVDFKRGNCTVEDDGLGIPSAEFLERGGLGKPYHTSKHRAEPCIYGRHGLFLSAIGAVSFLCIHSRRRHHRSTNGLTLHLSSVIARHIPAPPSESITTQTSGTRVTVRNLFGNMPVRVKHRGAVMQDASERARAWGEMKRTILALLLAWRHPLSLTIREVNSELDLRLILKSPPDVSRQLTPQPLQVSKTWVNSLLLNAGLVEHDSHNTWVSVNASSHMISVTGLISLQPAPSRHVQFISIGNVPILPSQSNNELYSHINAIFDRSDFGTVDIDDWGIADSQSTSKKERQAQGFMPKRHLRRAAKGTDRWPMFVLNVDHHRQRHSLLSDISSASPTSLQAIVQILETLSIEWLTKNGYRLQYRKQKRPKVAFGAESEGVDDDSSQVADSMDVTPLNPGSTVEATNSPVRVPIVVVTPRVLRTPLRTISNHESRIRSSKSFTPSGKTPRRNLISPAASTQAETTVVHIPEAATNKESRFQSAQSERNRYTDDTSRTHDISDQICIWQDPITKQSYHMNARTGQAIIPIPSRLRPGIDTGPTVTSSSRPGRPITLSRTKKTKAPDEVETGEWLRNAMSEWTDPVFKQTEQCIPRARTDLTVEENREHRSGLTCARQNDHDIHTMSSSRLSKSGLSNVFVISQVDNKFILIKMSDAAVSSAEKGASNPGEILVLVDQHAADERCRLEDLLRQLVSAPSTNDSTYQSGLGYSSQIHITVLTSPLIYEISAQDVSRFTDEAARFARWGILYSVNESSSSEPSIPKAGRPQLFVQALPPVIAARCQTDPKVLIDLLRAEIWRDDRPRGLNPSKPPTHHDWTDTSSTADIRPQHAWLSQLADIPRGLLDLLNSRACRSAIMFNDVLTIRECQDLISRLAQCAFPFQCAHGRPSMTPLVELGGSDAESVSADLAHELDHQDRKKGFFKAFAAWRGQ